MEAEAPWVLVVDDEPDVCWALRCVIQGTGVPVRTVETGRDALACLTKQRPQVVFLDAKLPDVEGLELARRIRAWHRDLRVIMVSGYFYTDDLKIRKAIEDGVINDFMSKPFEHARSRRIVQEAG